MTCDFCSVFTGTTSSGSALPMFPSFRYVWFFSFPVLFLHLEAQRCKGALGLIDQLQEPLVCFFFLVTVLKPCYQSHCRKDMWKWGADPSHMGAHRGLLHCAEKLTRKGRKGPGLGCQPPPPTLMRDRSLCQDAELSRLKMGLYRAVRASESP